jgi:TPP-dependent pyruvate/acetoin dehydrogenase alpha subunit
MTYRWKEHVGPNEDYQLGYRPRSEAEPWMKEDEVPKIGAKVEPARRKEIETAVEQEIKEAFAFAEQSPFPDYPELFTDVCKEA